MEFVCIHLKENVDEYLYMRRMKKETGTEGMAKVKGLEVCKGGWVYRGVCVCSGRVCGGSGRGGGGARRQMEVF